MRVRLRAWCHAFGSPISHSANNSDRTDSLAAEADSARDCSSAKAPKPPTGTTPGGTGATGGSNVRRQRSSRLHSPERSTRFANTSSNAVNSRSTSVMVSRGRGATRRTTRSAAGKLARCRKDSLIIRLTRFRSTASRTTRLATIIPNRGIPTKFGRAANQSPPRRTRNNGWRSTASNSRSVSSRRPRPNLCAAVADCVSTLAVRRSSACVPWRDVR